MSLAFAKPILKKRGFVRAKELRVVKRIRDAVRQRDRECRFPAEARVEWPCHPFLGAQWAHRPAWRRSRTRNKPPEERHQTQGSYLLCQLHHTALDHGEICEEAVDSTLGADGVIRWHTAAGDFLGES